MPPIRSRMAEMKANNSNIVIAVLLFNEFSFLLRKKKKKIVITIIRMPFLKQISELSSIINAIYSMKIQYFIFE